MKTELFWKMEGKEVKETIKTINFSYFYQIKNSSL